MTEHNFGDGIKVDVDTLYIETESDPDNDRYVFAYTITIQNIGEVAAKLLTRHWIIRDDNGKKTGSTRRWRCWETTTPEAG